MSVKTTAKEIKCPHEGPGTVLLKHEDGSIIGRCMMAHSVKDKGWASLRLERLGCPRPFPGFYFAPDRCVFSSGEWENVIIIQGGN